MVRAVALTGGLAACGHFEFARTPDAGGDGGGTDADLDAADDADIDAGLDPDLLVWFAFESDGFLLDRVSATNGTCESGMCPEPVAGPRGDTAASFNFDCVKLPAPMAQPTAFTFALWVWHDVDHTSTLFGRTLAPASSSDNVFRLGTQTASTAYTAAVAGAEFPASTTLGVWHHVAAVWNAPRLVIFVDGSSAVIFSDSNAEVVYQSPGDLITVGCDVDTGIDTTRTAALIDDVRLYGRALTATEIAVLAQ